MKLSRVDPRAVGIMAFLVSLLLLVALSSCTSSSPQGQPSLSPTGAPPTTPTTPPAPPATFALSGAKRPSPDLALHPLTFTSSGIILEGTLRGPQGMELQGSSTGSTLSFSAGTLKRDTSYTVTGRVKNSAGAEAQRSVTFTTLDPKVLTTPTIIPSTGDTVGVAMPITLQFTRPVKDLKARARVESLAQVTSTPAIEGTWGWLDGGLRAVWRPSRFWTPGTKVSVKAPLEDLDLGRSMLARRGVSTTFTVGRALALEVSNRTKTITVREGGKIIRTAPVSLGKPGHETTSGIHIIYGKSNPERMKGEDYNLLVNFAQRYSTTGEYLHSAPWSVGSQGRVNVSHGCVNMPPGFAKWLYSKTILGDPVIVTGTSKKAPPLWDGMGAVWNASPAAWRALSSGSAS